MIAKKQEEKGKKATHVHNIFPKQNQSKRYFGVEGPDRGVCLQHHFTSSFHLEDSLAPSRHLSVVKMLLYLWDTQARSLRSRTGSPKSSTTEPNNFQKPVSGYKADSEKAS